MNAHERHVIMLALLNKQRLKTGYAAQLSVVPHSPAFAITDGDALQILIYERAVYLEILFEKAYYTPMTDAIQWQRDIDPTRGWHIIEISEQSRMKLISNFQKTREGIPMDTPDRIDERELAEVEEMLQPDYNDRLDDE